MSAGKTFRLLSIALSINWFGAVIYFHSLAKTADPTLLSFWKWSLYPYFFVCFNLTVRENYQCSFPEFQIHWNILRRSILSLNSGNVPLIFSLVVCWHRRTSRGGRGGLQHSPPPPPHAPVSKIVKFFGQNANVIRATAQQKQKTKTLKKKQTKQRLSQ